MTKGRFYSAVVMGWSLGGMTGIMFMQAANTFAVWPAFLALVFLHFLVARIFNKTVR
jgi:hypothetical protein